MGGAFVVVGGARMSHEKRPVEMGTSLGWGGYGTRSKEHTFTELSSAHGGRGLHWNARFSDQEFPKLGEEMD